MKVGMPLVLFVLSLSSIQLCGQCARPELKPVWDPAQQQFKCVSPSAPPGPPFDDVISAKGDKDFCGGVRDNLQKVCPSSDEGKICKSKTKSIFNSCYKDFKGQSSVGPGPTSESSKTDRAVCMQTFTQQQQACQSRKLPPSAPGQPYVPDTCLHDAMAAQDKCLANSR
jgi:hypothetical protein